MTISDDKVSTPDFEFEISVIVIVFAIFRIIRVFGILIFVISSAILRLIRY